MARAFDDCVDAYNDHCYGRLLPGHVRLTPKASTRRRIARSLRRASTFAVALATFCTVALVATPAQATTSAAPHKLAPPPNTVHHTRIIGHIEHDPLPGTCSPGTPSPPPPAITTLAYVAEASSNEVQAIDEATGALVGTPITVGTSPKGVGYWRPPVSSHMDPEIVVSNSGSHSVTLIDAVTQSVLATVTLPGGSSATAVATSPTQDFALVVDTESGKVSIIDLATETDLGEISLTSTTNVLTSIAFSASGQYAYVTDPSEHKIFVIDATDTSPYYAYDSTYTNASYDLSGVAADLSSSSSTSFYVTDAQASGYLLKFTVAGTLSAPTQVKHFSSPSETPGAVSVSPGSVDAWVALTGTKDVDEVNLSTGATTTDTVNSSFTSVGPLGLAADGSTLLAADTGSSSVQELSTTTGDATNTTSPDARVYAIAPALAQSGSWDAYVTDGYGGIDVVNTGTLSVTETISDSNGPIASVASPDGKYVYVLNRSTPSVSVIATADVGTPTNPVIHVWPISQGLESNAVDPGAIAINPPGTSLLVTDLVNGAVEVIDTNPSDTSQYGTVVKWIGLAGSGISSSLGPLGITVGPDGGFAYVTEGDGTSTDGVAVLQLASSTTTGYTFLADNESLSQGSVGLYWPGQITVNPNDESVYIWGSSSSDTTPAVYELPIGTNGELSDGTGAPVDFGSSPGGLAFSPEDDLLFATSTASNELSAITEPAGTVNYESATYELPSDVAVSPDGEYVGVTTWQYCDTGINSVEIFDAGSGTAMGDVELGFVPSSITFAPQASPQAIATAELAGGASNPAEAAVTSGMNDVVTSGTPSDAPGASAGVDTATGAYSMSLDSMDIPDVGIGLDQTAAYDSGRSTVAGLLGKGWDYTYGITATQNPDSGSNKCAIIVTQEDGATVTFHPAAVGSSCPTSGYEAPGWAQATMTFQSSCNGSDSCFVMTRGAMTKYFIDETTGELVKIEDLNGNAVTITWGSHTACSGATSGEPCQVTGADGIRTLTFSYPSPGSGTCPSAAASCVVVTDPLGRTLTYALNSSSQLTSVSLSNGTETATYAFTYNSSNLMTGWWDPNNEAAHSGATSYATDVTWSGSRGTQVTGPEIASVAPLSTTPITPTTTFAYSGFAGSTGNGTVLIGNPDFNQSNYEPGASQTLDTYADFELVSSVQGYGPVAVYDNGSTAPVVPVNPSESATPLRDAYNLMPSESMNALAGSTESAVGSQNAQYDNGIVQTTFDAHGNVLSTTDESGVTTSSTYNGLNEAMTSTDALGNVTTSTYNSAGEVLTTISPPTSDGGSSSKISDYYNSNGTICASRDADQVEVYGVLSSCVSAGSNATTYTYDDYGDATLTTVTDNSTQTSTTENEFDADGNVCATLNPVGYAITGDQLTGCPASGAPYASVTLLRDVYGRPLEVSTSLAVTPSDTYATTYVCTDDNGNTLETVGSIGSFSSCSALSETSSIDTTFNTFDPEGDLVNTVEPFASTGTQGPTTTSQFDADGNLVLSLSADGYVIWAANHSATLAPYETGTLSDDQGNLVASAPETDLTSPCESDISAAGTGSIPSALCPDTTLSTLDAFGQLTGEINPGTQSGSSSPLASSTTNNPVGTDGGDTSGAGGGTTSVAETSQKTYDKNNDVLSTVNEHWTGSTWAVDSSSSTAYEPDGTKCWTSSTIVSSPSCGSPPVGTTVSYFDPDGRLIAEVGPGGSNTVTPGGACDPLTAVATMYSINTSDLCAFTTYFSYDEAGLMTEMIGPSTSSSTSIGVSVGPTTTYGYDPGGGQTTLVNPAGNTVTSMYDGAGRLVGITYSDVSSTNCTAGGSAQDTCYLYSSNGDRSQMIDSTGTTSYSYNDASQLSSVTDSNGNTVTYGYNAFGQENCVSYPGFANDCSSTGAGTNSPPAGDVTYDYDSQGRISSVVDWNGDAFTYGYDCAGDTAWMAETPASQIPTVAQCESSSGSVPTAPAPTSSGSTYVVTSSFYSSAGSGELLSYQTTSAATSSGSTPLLDFGASSSPLTYDDSNDLMSGTPYKTGSALATDEYATTPTPYDSQQRVPLSPEPLGWSTAYDYVNSGGSPPFTSENTVDGMGIDVMPAASSGYTGVEYSGNGELCWEALEPTASSSSPCTAPASPSTYQSFSYNTSGDLVGTVAHGFGANSASVWNVDTGNPACVNPAGSSCTGPNSSQQNSESYKYNADGLRMTSTFWNPTSSSTETNDFTWDTVTSALLSDGAFDYIYADSNVPVAEIDVGDSITTELIEDPSSNVRGLVEVSSESEDPFSLVNYTDYDAYGNPISASGGSVNSGGLTNDGEIADPSSASAFGFGGGYTDATGLIYLVNRYYDPAVGQFDSLDPAVSQTGTPYAYASDSPPNISDLLGEDDALNPFWTADFGGDLGAYGDSWVASWLTFGDGSLVGLPEALYCEYADFIDGSCTTRNASLDDRIRQWNTEEQKKGPLTPEEAWTKLMTSVYIWQNACVPVQLDSSVLGPVTVKVSNQLGWRWVGKGGTNTHYGFLESANTYHEHNFGDKNPVREYYFPAFTLTNQQPWVGYPTYADEFIQLKWPNIGIRDYFTAFFMIYPNSCTAKETCKNPSPY
jgi:RHS repeat-associated protein